MKAGYESEAYYKPDPGTIIYYYTTGLNNLSPKTATIPQSILLRVSLKAAQINLLFRSVNPLANYLGIPADTWPVEANRSPYDLKLEWQPKENVEKTASPSK